MVSSEIILNYLSQNKERFLKEYSLIKIGIFGSYARNENNEKSDIDIIVEFQDNTTDLSEKKFEIRKELQSKFKIPVDICREKYIKPVFKQQIISEAIYV
jgi:hypothetical protein